MSNLFSFSCSQKAIVWSFQILFQQIIIRNLYANIVNSLSLIFSIVYFWVISSDCSHYYNLMYQPTVQSNLPFLDPVCFRDLETNNLILVLIISEYRKDALENGEEILLNKHYPLKLAQRSNRFKNNQKKQNNLAYVCFIVNTLTQMFKL